MLHTNECENFLIIQILYSFKYEKEAYPQIEAESRKWWVFMFDKWLNTHVLS